MSYNKTYNTRHSGRYNTPGHFVPSGERSGGEGAGGFSIYFNNPAPTLKVDNNTQKISTVIQKQTQPPPLDKPVQQSPAQIAQPDTEMKVEPSQGDQAMETSTNEEFVRPSWMKTRLPGVKKISNRERRRRQNENLRRLLSPKNALMVLNEMLPNEHVANQFKVEPATGFNPYYNKTNGFTFCADLTLEGNSYKGYGDNKLAARNSAAEQAIRDLIIRKMNKAIGAPTDATTTTPTPTPTSTPAPTPTPTPTGDTADGAESVQGEESGMSEAGDDEALPMIQLASYALHKLFCEWEYEGFKMPQLKPTPPSTTTTTTTITTTTNAPAIPSVGDTASEASEASESSGPPATARRAGARKPKEIPAAAPAMHPCMVLTHMRPNLEYRELNVAGDRPQNMVFTMGVDVDGTTYVGKASNKKEARKNAAKAACQALFNVHFQD